MPWSRLSSEPVQITINELFLIATPIGDRQYDAAEQQATAAAAKKIGLASAGETLQEVTAGKFLDKPQEV